MNRSGRRPTTTVNSLPPKRKRTPASATATARVERRALKLLHPLDEAVELLYYSQLGVTREANDYLSQFGFTQAHHRILYVLARHEGLSVGELTRVLGISKQATQRPLKQLTAGKYIAVARDAREHRTKLLTLTTSGQKVEREATSRKRAVIKKAFEQEKSAEGMWMIIMRAIAEHA